MTIDLETPQCDSVLFDPRFPEPDGTILAEMDPEDSVPVRSALKVQFALLHWLEEQLAFVRQEMLEATIRNESALATLKDKLNFIIDRLQISEQPSISPIAPKGSEAAAEPPAPTVGLRCLQLSSPEHFSGESGDCCPFISQCELHFEFNASAFSSDQAKIAFIISHLTGRARSWATAEWSYDQHCLLAGIY